jgi:hypothetical protein
MKLPRESFSFWNTHRHTHPSHPHIIPDFEHQSNHFHVCPVDPFTPETGIYIYSTMAGAIGFFHASVEQVELPLLPPSRMMMNGISFSASPFLDF